MNWLKSLTIVSLSIFTMLCVGYAHCEPGRDGTKIYSHNTWGLGSCNLKVTKEGSTIIFIPDAYAVPFLAEIPVGLVPNMKLEPIEISYPGPGNQMREGFNGSFKLKVRVRVDEHNEIVPLGYEIQNLNNRNINRLCPNLSPTK